MTASKLLFIEDALARHDQGEYGIAFAVPSRHSLIALGLSSPDNALHLRELTRAFHPLIDETCDNTGFAGIWYMHRNDGVALHDP